MTRLITTPNIPDQDGFYAELIAAHEGLAEDESAALNARLILLLANQVGDRALLSAAIAAARTPGGDDRAPADPVRPAPGGWRRPG